MDKLKRLGLTVLVAVVCLIPTWIFIGARTLFSPQGFWQNLAVTGLGLVALGGLQVFGLILLVMCLYYLWTN